MLGPAVRSEPPVTKRPTKPATVVSRPAPPVWRRRLLVAESPATRWPVPGTTRPGTSAVTAAAVRRGADNLARGRAGAPAGAGSAAAGDDATHRAKTTNSDGRVTCGEG